MVIHELLNKYIYRVPEETPVIILDSKTAVCMANKIKDTNYTMHIDIRVNFGRNGEKCKMNKIDMCEGGLKLANIETKNVGENDLNCRIKYIMIILDK